MKDYLDLYQPHRTRSTKPSSRQAARGWCPDLSLRSARPPKLLVPHPARRCGKDPVIASQQPTSGARAKRGTVVVLVVSFLVLGLVAFGLGRLLGGSDSSSPNQPGPSSSTHEFFTDPHGSDKDEGTADKPFRTIEQGLEALRPGDTLTIGDGTYHERLKHLEISPGTADDPITVRAAPGASPVLKGLLWLPDASYWHLSGLDVTWDDDNGKHDHMVKFQGGTGWSMTDAEVWGSRSQAAILVTDNSSKWRLAHLFVHSTHDTGGNNQDQLIYVSSTSGGGLIERCLLTDSPNGRGVKIGPPDARSSRIGDVVIRYNTFYDNMGPSNIQLSRNSSGNQIYRNIFMKPGDDEANVTAYELEGSDNSIHDNIYVNSTPSIADHDSGLDVGDGNLQRDPRFVSPEKDDFHPQDPVSERYGAYAGQG